MEYLLKHGQVFTQGRFQNVDILLRDGRIAAVGGPISSGGDGLLIRKSRLPQMYVYIHETGKNKGTAKINGNTAAGGNTPPYSGDLAVTEKDIDTLESVVGKNLSIFQQILHAAAPFSHPFRF